MRLTLSVIKADIGSIGRDVGRPNTSKRRWSLHSGAGPWPAADHYISHTGDEESSSSGMKPWGAEERLGRLAVDFRIQSDGLVVSDGDIPKVLWRQPKDKLAGLLIIGLSCGRHTFAARHIWGIDGPPPR